MKKIKRTNICELELLKTELKSPKLPDVLLCREKECNTIKKFITNALLLRPLSMSRVLCISGVPGTGKTASVLKVVENLKKEKKSDFKFLNVNGLELSEPKFLFVKLYRKVKEGYIGANKKISPRDAHQFLNDNFTNGEKKGHKPCVVLIDEVDMIYTKREDVVYTLFNWAAIENSRLSVIAISNTLDLAERTFSQRIVSRMGGNKLVFQPYEFQEIETILKNRIEKYQTINDKTIELASKKIASISGDIRKALQLMCRAIDLALEKCKNQNVKRDVVLLPAHVLEAINESISSIRMEFIAALSKHEELLFRALVLILYEYALEDTNFIRVLNQYKKLCTSEMITPLPLFAAFEHLKELSLFHLIIISTEQGELHCKIKLGFSISEAQFCLRQLDNTRKKTEILASSCLAKSTSKSPKRNRCHSTSPSRVENRNRISTNPTSRRKIDFKN